MITNRPIHPDFLRHLDSKPSQLVQTFCELRNYLLSFNAEAIEILYHTHALTAVFSLSERLSDAYCHVPVYTGHLNLGFNKGALLQDPEGLLQGTGKLIRHLPVEQPDDWQNPAVQTLLREAIDLARTEMDKPAKITGVTVSKIKN